uniref:Uncharacterized protein n=1 Tax=Arundo donax TaxID=35708 RepID=A0A0A8Y051_ARUDO
MKLLLLQPRNWLVTQALISQMQHFSD